MPQKGRVVIVTGAGGTGCGRSIALRFAMDGAAVIVSDMDEEGGRNTVRLIEENKGRGAFFQADVRDDPQVQQLVSFAEKEFGRLDVLVNNASAPHGDTDIESWWDPIETDLLGTIRATRSAIDVMRRGGGGAIVNIASISALWHGRTTPGGLPGYDVAKAGIIRMTTRLACLAQSDSIRVNCLAPGWIGTDEVQRYWASLTPEERAERNVPARLLSTHQIAEAVVRLADDTSLSGRILVWWSEDSPRLIPWGDRGYYGTVDFL